MKRVNKWYPFQIWILTLLIGPAIMLIDLLVRDNFLLERQEYGFLIYAFLYGLIGSLPLLGVCYLIFYLFIRRGLPEFYTKIILILISIAGIMTSFYYFLGNNASLRIDSIYSIAVILSSCIFKIYKLPKKDLADLIYPEYEASLKEKTNQ
jgi:hypothetical protein